MSTLSDTSPVTLDNVTSAASATPAVVVFEPNEDDVATRAATARSARASCTARSIVSSASSIRIRRMSFASQSISAAKKPCRPRSYSEFAILYLRLHDPNLILDGHPAPFPLNPHPPPLPLNR